MKKSKKFMSILMLSCLFATVFSGCNFVQIIDTGAGYLDSQAFELAENSGTEDSQSDDKNYSSIDDYIKSPLNQVAIKQLFGESDEEKSVEIVPEENNLVIEYRYYETFDEQSIKSTAARHSEIYKFNSEAFVKLANSIKNEVNIEDPSVILRYYNGDGTFIYELEFKADLE